MNDAEEEMHIIQQQERDKVLEEQEEDS